MQKTCISFAIISVLIILVSVISSLKTQAYTIIDYDFYFFDDYLYAFVIEGQGENKYFQENDREYRCGKHILLFKSSLKENSFFPKRDYSAAELSDKSKRQKLFNPQQEINQLLHKMQLVYRNDFTAVNPWLITVGQLDEDQAIEVFIGAFRSTNFYPAGPRPYFFEFKEGFFVRQWTGSYLDNLYFTDGYFIDEDYDGISLLRLEETVAKGGMKVQQEGEFTIRGFHPIRLAP